VRPPPQGLIFWPGLGSHGGSLWERDEEEIKKSSGEKRRERGMSIILE
jgi:hypothetical protein